jgi:tRNA (Thr-GGU) A37 N-methylase
VERIWLLFVFHNNSNWKAQSSPPVAPNRKIGVFATRSPYRPNPIGLSCVELVKIEKLKIYVRNFDLLDNTPILDIKPYIPYSDSFPDALGGFTDSAEDFILEVVFPENLLKVLPENKRQAAIGVLSHDPRPSYQRKPDRVYGLGFAGFDIRFTVEEKVLTVCDVIKCQ